jgi:hypothetical protein
MGFKLGNVFTPKAMFKSALTGGLTTAHNINKQSPGYKKLFPDGTSPPDAPPAPTIDSAEAAAMDKEEQLRRRRGMAATSLGGMDTTHPTTMTPSLLGS